MTGRSVAFDLSRLFVGAAGRTPRGIDRVDMGFARALLGDAETRNVGLLPSPSGMGMLRGAEAWRMAERVERHWRENRPAGEDGQHGQLQAWLAGRSGSQAEPAPPARRGRAALVGRYGDLALGARWSPLRPAARHVPQNSLVLTVGQVLLGWPWFFRWLDRRPDVKVVMMMHDLIPVLYPEYSGPILARHHQRAVRTAAARASAMLATSHASADELRDALARLGRADMPFHVTPLPVDESFTAPTSRPASLPPYLVAVGILDQRKNHRLLLHVWRAMLQRGVPDIPKLVIAGSRGLRVSEILDMLVRAPGLSEHVRVVSGLSSPALRDVVAGARAVLMPSFTEGFGLPIVEALALGTPVIASDIPAHREVGGAVATYLDPLDGPGWMRAVLQHARGEAGRRVGGGGPSAPPQTWASYLADVMPFLRSL